MKKILFVTTRNILKTSGEQRLIKNRSNTLFSVWGIETEFIVLDRNNSFDNKRVKKDFITYVLKVNKYNPVDIFLKIKQLKKILLRKVNSGNYSCIVFSGIGTLPLQSYVKKLNKDISLFADIHGAVEDIKETAKDKSLFKKIYLRFAYYYSRYSESRFLKHMDGIFVVSNALADYLTKEYGLINANYYVVPCSIEKDQNMLSNREIYRMFYREKYGIKPNEKLFIYSGGVSPWQCIDKTLEIFNKLKRRDKNFKMLVLSHKIEKILPKIKDNENIITDSLDAEEVNKVLSAGDYAFLIREDIITNHVAFPNKFLEYVQSGMKIITTPYVYDIAELVKKYNIGLVIDVYKDYEQQLLDYIYKNNNIEMVNRKKLLTMVSFDETLKKFVKEIKIR